MPDYLAKEGSSQVESALSNVDELRNSLNKLMLKLPHINQGPRAYVYGEKNGNWGPSRYLIENDVEGSDGTLSEDYSMPNDTDGDDGTQTLLRCQFCDFDIMLSVKHDRLDDLHIFDPEKMICPACDEKFGEDTIRFVQSSILQKAWKSEKYNILYGNSTMTDKKLHSWGKSNVSVPRLSDMKSSASDTDTDEDSISIYSDTSTAKSSETELAADTSDEQEQEVDEEKNLRATFVRDLVLSTMI